MSTEASREQAGVTVGSKPLNLAAGTQTLFLCKSHMGYSPWGHLSGSPTWLLKTSKEQKHSQGRKRRWEHEVVCTALAPQYTDGWCDCRGPGTQSKWELYNTACQEAWPYIKSRIAMRKLLMNSYKGRR